MVTASTRNQTISSDSASRPEQAKMTAQTANGNVVGSTGGWAAGGSAAGSRDRERSATEGSRTRAQATLSATPMRRLPSRPRRGRNTHVESNAPVAAPSVLTPYSTPMTVEARSMREASARDSSGSDAPMKKVGQRRLAN